MSNLLNEMDYKLITLDYPNIQAKWNTKSGDEPPTIVIEPKLKELAVALALKYPQWRLVCHRMWNNFQGDGKAQVQKFSVYEGNENLGEISSEYGGGRFHCERVFTLRNERIASARERGDRVRTKDLGKALKIAAKMFYTKNLNEYIDEAANNVRRVTYEVARDRFHTFQRKFSHMWGYLEDYSVQQFDSLRDAAIRAGADTATLDDYINAYQEHKATEEIESCYEKGKGWVVLIRGSDYAVTSSNDNRQVTMYTTDTLPPHIKRGIGMLKLLEDNTFMSGVGVRRSESTFFITDKRDD